MEKKCVIKTVEMNTGGEAVRIVVAGYPPVKGSTILEQRQYAKAHLDHLRTMLMAEPRGHLDMYGALLVEKTNPQADLAVLFMHNEGYSTMCGHACISLGRYAVDYKIVQPVAPETPVNIQCPAGLVKMHVQYDAETGRTGSVRFESVPSYAFEVDRMVQVAGFGSVKYDIVYGGAFYAFVDVHQLNMDLEKTPVQELMLAATAIKKAVRSKVTLTHPQSADLAFLYGVILTDGKDDGSSDVAKHLTVFADQQVDRSTCGSGTTARTALQYHKGLRKIGEKRTFQNGKTGSSMTSVPLRVEPYGCYDNAVVVEVSGRGYYTGEASFWMEEEDPKARGFLIH